MMSLVSKLPLFMSMALIYSGSLTDGSPLAEGPRPRLRVPGSQPVFDDAAPRAADVPYDGPRVEHVEVKGKRRPTRRERKASAR